MGAELAYVGSTRSAGAFGDRLVTHGAEAVLSLQHAYETGRWLVEPFAFGGVGLTHFSLAGASGWAVRDRTDQFVMPMGGGLTVAGGRVLLDARFTCRQTFGEDLLRAEDGGDASLKSWAITTSVGYEF